MNWYHPRVFSLIFLTGPILFWSSFFLYPPVPDRVGQMKIASFPTAAPLSASWCQGIANWAVERCPFRYRCIAARNFTSYSLAQRLDPLPVNPGHDQVATGRNGWLFLFKEAVGHRKISHLELNTARALDLAQLITTSGRKFRFVPAPNKSAIYPKETGTIFRNVQASFLDRDLSTSLPSAFHNSALDECFIDLWAPLLAAQPKRDLLYWNHDTHWKPSGMVIAVEQIVNSLQPGLWQADCIHEAGTRRIQGDLMGNYLLLPFEESATDFVVRRPGMTPSSVSSTFAPNFHFSPIRRFKTEGGPVIEGRTVVIGDSFIHGTMDLLTPWFEDITFAHLDHLGSPQLAEHLLECQTLIISVIERNFRDRIGNLTGQHRTYLSEALSPPSEKRD